MFSVNQVILNLTAEAVKLMPIEQIYGTHWWEQSELLSHVMSYMLHYVDNLLTASNTVRWQGLYKATKDVVDRRHAAMTIYTEW